MEAWLFYGELVCVVEELAACQVLGPSSYRRKLRLEIQRCTELFHRPSSNRNRTRASVQTRIESKARGD